MNTELWSLFISAFISSTLFPGGSEALLLYLASEGNYSVKPLLISATAGNTLGGMSSWLIGWLIASRFPAKKLSHKRQQQALAWIERHGSPVLLLSWLPVIGDPLCVMAGWLRISWWQATVYICIGKALRYYILLLPFT
ncbi:MAG: DedA family protein [Gammaproteobacteria bacterium]|nr:DedA family protein [Gammaproteobacteria bacterium]